MRLHDHLEYWARLSPGEVCVADGRRSWRYGEVDRQANLVAQALRSLGVGPGDRFGIIAENCLEWFALYFGSFKSGAVPVPMNYRLNPHEWVRIANDACAKAIFAQSAYLGGVDSVAPQLTTVKTLVALDGATGRWADYASLLKAQTPAPVEGEVRSTDAAYQMYTSGTTGRAKGAVVSHAAVDSNMRQTQTALALRPRSRSLIVMPLYHAGAAVSSFSTLAIGGNILLRRSFDAADCVRILDEEHVTIATFVPAMIQAMLVSVADVCDRSYATLERIAYGASPIADATLRQAMHTFGCEFVQAYGMTECSSVLTLLSAADHQRALADRHDLLLSCGRPLAGTSVRVVDAEDRDVAVREMGQIIARGPQLMDGYWNMPEATQEALRGGWMHTGDVGYLDEEGYLYVCDRFKDVIVSGGENIYPREIEDVLFEMPDVADAAVIAVPDEKWGEAAKAVIVVRHGAEPCADDVIAWCRQRLAGFKCPKSVDFVNELPRNPSGKVLKRVLREPYWQGAPRRVG